MRTSHIALLSALGVIALVIVAQAGTTRYVLSRADAFASQPSASAPMAEAARELPLTDFDSVRVHGRWEITFTRGPEWHVELSHPEDTSDLVEAEVRDGELRLAYRAPRGLRLLGIGFGGAGSARATVVMPELAQLHLEGATTATLTGFEGERLVIMGFGAHRVEGRESRYDALELTLNGAGEAALRDVLVTDANVNLAGANEVALTINGGVLSGSMAGAGRLAYHGTVSEQTVSVAGAVRVQPGE